MPGKIETFVNAGGAHRKLVAHLCCRIINDLLRRQIRLVPHQQLVDTLNGVSVDLLQPLLDVGVCVWERQPEHRASDCTHLSPSRRRPR